MKSKLPKPKDMEEIYRRIIVQEKHSIGTLIRKEEIERIKLITMPLYSRCEALSKVEINSPLEFISDLLTDSETDEEMMFGLFQGLGKTGSWDGYLAEVNNLVTATNNILSQLEVYGVYFNFPRFQNPIGVEMARDVTLPSISGFLKGVLEIKK